MRLLTAVFCVISFFLWQPCSAELETEVSHDLFDWTQLPDLPEPLGVAGPYAGISNDALIVAGGAHFPTPLFEGGKKVWVDTIHVLEKKDDAYVWNSDNRLRLNRPLAYGAAITTDDGVICIGGGDAGNMYREVFRLRWVNGSIEETPLPDLPEPCAFTSAARVGDIIYVAGGQNDPKAVKAMKNFWSLDLSNMEAGWKEHDPWPGPARILPVAASFNDAFYLFSGAELIEGEDGKTTRRYLTDAYRFDAENGWKRLSNLPKSVTAAPTPGVSYGQSHILVFGGSDGAIGPKEVWELKEKHPGFSRDILAYHTITDTWAIIGKMPAAHVTTTLVEWDGSIVIPSGEIRPGTRTAKIFQGIPVSHKRTFGLINYFVLIVYFAALVWMGFYFSKREKSTDDFFLAGRRIPWWAAGLSIYATQLSAITYMAIPAKVFATNWVYYLANMCIVLIAPVIVFVYLPFYRRLNLTTAYEYLEKRFNLAVRLFGSCAYILLQLGRMAIVIFLPAIALSTVTGINIYMAILLMGVFCTLYTVLGGIEAVIWSDVLQAIVLLGGALLSLVIIIFSIDGGLASIFSVAASSQKFHMVNWTWDWTTTAIWVILFGNFLNQLVPYTSDQTVVQRYLTTKNEKEAAKSIWASALLTIPGSLLFFGLGTALFVFYKTHPGFLDPSIKTDAIFPLFIVQQLPVGICGLVIGGLFAAAMSSLDSSMNSVSTAVVTDFYRRFTHNPSEKKCLNLARVVTIILGVIGTGVGLLMATTEIKSLWDLFITILGLFGGSLAGLFALGIFTRRAHGSGALIGAITSVIVLFMVQRFTHIHFFLYGATGILTCFIVGYLASIIISAKEQQIDGMTIYTLKKQ